jgi:predicted nucleic acid-binding protein
LIVLDASVLVGHLSLSDVHHRRATTLLIEAAEEPFGASPITLAEVLVGPARSGSLDRANAVLVELGIQNLGLSDGAPSRLAALRAATGLKLPDCCVLLAAEQEGSELATFDDQLASAARARGIRLST